MRDYDIESDLKQEKFQSIKLVQGDRGNKIKINVYEDGQPVNLTGCSITAKYKRSDGEIVDGTVENKTDNYFYAVMDNNITKVAGTLKMLFNIENGDVKVSTFLLLADVREGIGENTGSSGGDTEVTVDLKDYQKKTDNGLETKNKYIVGAINEVNSQCKDIAKQIENIGTGGGSTNTGIPTFLKGKKYIAIGDSIVENQGTTANPITYSGTDLQGIVHTEEVVKGYIQEIENRYGLVCTNLGKGGHTIVNDYANLMNINYSDVALVTIAYGCNDARLSVPLGTVNSSDGTTFAGALNNILRKIYTDNPECRVIVLTALQRLYVSEFGIATANSNGNYLIDFVDMCKKVANKRSTKCIDVYRDCGINQTNLYYYTREGVHPLNTGYKRMSGAIIPVLDDMLSIEFNPFGTMTNTGDTEPEEPNPGGGGSGGDTPTEDPKATVVDISTLFTNTGYIYDNWGNVNNNSLYQYTTPIELINGKTYTLITIVQSDFSTPYGCMTNTSTDFSTHKSINAGVTSENVTINGTVYKQITAIITVPSSEDTYYIWINKFKAIDVSKCSLSYV